jgi:hypothetical protein
MLFPFHACEGCIFRRFPVSFPWLVLFPLRQKNKKMENEDATLPEPEQAYFSTSSRVSTQMEELPDDFVVEMFPSPPSVPVMPRSPPPPPRREIMQEHSSPVVRDPAADSSCASTGPSVGDVMADSSSSSASSASSSSSPSSSGFIPSVLREFVLLPGRSPPAPRSPPPVPRSPPPSSPPARTIQRNKRYESRDMFFPPATCVCSVVDFFLIVGLKEESLEHREAEILFSHPPGIDEKCLSTAAKFCFPERIGTRRVRRSASGSSLNQLIHGSDQAFSRRHVFCVTGADGAFEWGVVLVKEELLALVPSVIVDNVANTGLNEVLEKGGTEFAAVDRAYCLVSRYPLFALHFDLLLSVLAHERSMRLLSSPSSASPVLEELNRALAVRIDRSVNQTIRMELFSRVATVELPFVERGDQLDLFFAESVLQQTLPTLLHRLSVSNLIRVFNAALLCKQILFRSRFAGVASAVALATSLLIRPLRWEGQTKKQNLFLFV